MHHINNLLQGAVRPGSPAAAPPESRPLEIGATRELATALADKKLPAAGLAGLEATLRYIFMLLGLRPQNYPVGLEADFLTQYIVKNFASHTNAEVRLAFDLAVAGRLALDAREVSCYENFSVAYFARIMQAYIAWARETYQLLPDKRPVPRRTPEQEASWHLDIKLGWAFHCLKEINKFPCKLKLSTREA